MRISGQPVREVAGLRELRSPVAQLLLLPPCLLQESGVKHMASVWSEGFLLGPSAFRCALREKGRKRKSPKGIRVFSEHLLNALCVLGAARSVPTVGSHLSRREPQLVAASRREALGENPTLRH